MSTREGQSVREQQLRRYFEKPPEPWKPPNTKPAKVAFWVSVGFLTLGILGLVARSGCLALFAIPLMAFGGLGVLLSSLCWFILNSNALQPKVVDAQVAMPTDGEVQQWLEEGIALAVMLSRQALGFVAQPMTNPLVITSPTLEATAGVPAEDLVFKRGEDYVWRFGLYHVLLIWPAEHELGTYSCDYNFLRDVPLNVQTKEFHYRDVVAISTGEASSSIAEPTTVKKTHWEEFRISVASGEAIRVLVSSDKLHAVTGEDQLPDTGVPTAVAAIRAMLREKKV